MPAIGIDRKIPIVQDLTLKMFAVNFFLSVSYLAAVTCLCSRCFWQLAILTTSEQV
jgi:hypothetical protein